MKKIKFIICTFITLSVITGCTKDYEELNTDPNNPVAVPAHLLLGTTQRVYMNVMHGVLGGAGGDMGAVWAQLWTKVQYNSEERYIPRRTVIDNIWDNAFASVIAEADAMEQLAIEEGNTNLQAAAMIMKASGFQFLTELFGPIPFTEAMNPSILKPVYDDEATIYNGIIEMYTEAASMLANGSGEIVASSDLFYGGDVTKWRKLANSLKFRALMRISSTQDVSSELQALVNGGYLMSSNADDAQVNYTATQPDANPIYELIDFGSRLEYKVNSLVVDRMTTLNDDRLPLYVAPAESDGEYRGKPAGYGDLTALPNEGLGYTYANISGLGDFYLDPELPGVLMSFSELSFLMAEAANEGYISGGLDAALNYYYTGIEASYEFHGISPSSYIGQEGLGFANQNDAREKIGEEKWLALFGQGFEAWTEWRRTNVPVLTPAVEGDINQIPSRYYYPTTEPSLNGDNHAAAASSIGGDELTSSLFWQ
ncbi:SusD/RagB family nutrient-binding outer membrane lipoprotein [Mangrovimonas sp. TPBH4]|uniref:SusD/RagB family nutrient-binding outer membrane lipoprotein n=1 Tax=Mangrovimonas sp. TPBH4 TaxID=1645914 RepID=UPI0006B4359D|nr:SusD/RagB family nutrient-binding outer membrane lipoprotein [Mangrovimonas sp. TPBH4]